MQLRFQQGVERRGIVEIIYINDGEPGVHGDSAKQAAAEAREFSLENGLKVIVQEDHRAPVVVSQVWYKVGSSYEHGGITGISHALEHMMFQGTARHGPGEFSRIISEHGGEENAFTGIDYTAYFQKLDQGAPRRELRARSRSDARTDAVRPGIRQRNQGGHGRAAVAHGGQPRGPG